MTDNDHVNTTCIYRFSIKTPIFFYRYYYLFSLLLLLFQKILNFFQWKSWLLLLLLFFLLPWHPLVRMAYDQNWCTRKMMDDCEKTMWNDIAPSEICAFWNSCEGTSKINEPNKMKRIDSCRFIVFISPIHTYIFFLFGLLLMYIFMNTVKIIPLIWRYNWLTLNLVKCDYLNAFQKINKMIRRKKDEVAKKQQPNSTVFVLKLNIVFKWGATEISGILRSFR